jgi:cyclic pyranopterin phosphate synthase
LQAFHNWGISKIRFTGGEPFVRPDFIQIAQDACAVGFENISITSNGTLLQKAITKLSHFGISKVNVSLDTLDRLRFHQITRRDVWDDVWNSILDLEEKEIAFRINTVLLRETAEAEVIQMMQLAHDKKWDWCFIEEMPFNGQGVAPDWNWNWRKIQSLIQSQFPDAIHVPMLAGDTTEYFELSNGARLGFIAAFSRTFCGTCNRLRLTPNGNLHHCLYSQEAYPLLDRIREGKSMEELFPEIQAFLWKKAINGFEAEKENGNQLPSMAQIGG